MNMKVYTVTNNGAGTVTLMGLRRVEIPGNVQNMQLSLPADTAKATVSRLKQRYPLLKIVEGTPKAEQAPVESPKAEQAAPVESNAQDVESKDSDASAKKTTKK